MTTVSFTVDVPAGAPIGFALGTSAHIAVYTAVAPSAPLPTDIIFCIAPTTLHASGSSSYTVLPGIQDGFTTQQVNALEAIFSNYLHGGDTSFNAQEATMLADWSVVDPSLHVTGVPTGVANEANALATEALNGTLGIDPNMQFVTYVNQSGGQDFVSGFDPVPLPASFGLLMAAVVLLTTLAMRKKFSFLRTHA